MKSIWMLLLVFLSVSSVDSAELEQRLVNMENRLGGRIGVAYYDTSSGERWSYRGDETFPIMSTFKPLACAKLLSDIHDGYLNRHQSAQINVTDIVSWSPVTKELTGSHLSLTSACEAMLSMSDNTAANIVLNSIGGPEGLTDYLRERGDLVTRIDSVEPFINQVSLSENTTTPNAMIKTLHTLLVEDGLTQSAQLELVNWMRHNRVSTALLRSVLPYGWLIADRSGSGSKGSRGITALVWKESRSPLIISIYLTETRLTLPARNQLIADIGEAIFSSTGVHP